MILKRVRLESFRCFAEPLEVGPLDERVTIVHGPNGVGKSTLMLALERVLFDCPDGTSSDLEALQPWGAQVMPRVVLDFSSGKTDYRLEKTFGARGQTRLLELEGERTRAISEGSAAVEWVRALYGGRSPGRGPSRPEHRGLAQLLFMPQGALELPDKLGEGAMERLRSVVGQVVVDAATRSIEEQLRKRYDELYTEKTGQPKRGAPAYIKEEELGRAREELEAARAAWTRCDELRRELSSAAQAAAGLDERRRALEADEARWKPRIAEYRALTRRRDDARGEWAQAERAFGEIAERIRAIAELKRRVEELAARVASRALEADAHVRALDEARRAADEATARLKAHEAGRAQLRVARLHAEDARALERARGELAEIGPRLDGFRAAQAEVESLERALEGAPAPSGRRIGELRRALAEERSAREQLEALKLRVRVRALEPVEVAAPGGESARLAPGDQREWSGEGALALTVGDLLSIEIFGPATDVPRARQEHEKRRAALDTIAGELGCALPEELEKRREAREAIETRLVGARARRAAFLPRDAHTAGDAPVSTLERRLETARKLEAELAARHPEWQHETPDAGALEAAARVAEQAFETVLQRLGETDGLCRRAAGDALTDCDLARAQLQRAREEHQGVAGELRAAAGDGKSDAEREEARRRESARAQRAEDQLRLAEAALAELPGDPERELERTARELRAVLDELLEKKERLGKADQALADAASAAPYSRLVEHEERAQLLGDELERARREAESIKLLHQLFADERARTAEALVEPVVARVVPRLRRLEGRVEGVTLDDAFKPRSVRLGGVDADVAALSFGTRDQLAVLMRLAMGEIAAGDAERLPAVLDDPLVHSDPERMERMLSVLEEAAGRVQLIVLTCRAEDYRGLKNARFIAIDGAGTPSA